MTSEKINCKTCTDKHCAVGTLNDAELELLSNNIVEARFSNREKLFKEGSLNGHVIYIKEGLVKVHMKVTDERDYILKIVTAPSYLGLPTIFGDNINHYSATAIGPTTACFIDINTFKQLIYDNGKFAFEIIADICKDELCSFRRYVNQTHKQTPGRLAGVLLYFAEKIYKNNHFTLSLTRNEIAELIGISRESVTRYLAKFNEDGIIKLHKNEISILNIDILQKINKAG